MFALLCLLIALAASAEVRYDGHSVLRVVPHNEVELQQIRQLLENEPQLDIWKEVSHVGRPVDFRVPPGERQGWLHKLGQYRLDVRIMMKDVQAVIDETTQSRPETPLKTRELDTSRYYDLAEIWEFLDEKVEQCGDLCEIISIGTSYEGRDLKVLKIGSPNEDSPAIWVDHNIHAREWISPAVGQYIIERLIADYGSDDEVTQLREGFNWYIDPVVNPDGYDYTWTTDRMWRKTRSDYGEECQGIDGNRNFDYGWGGPGSSDDPCSQTYRGPSAFSEIEIESINDFVSPIRDQFRLVYTFHSYGFVLLYPWGDGTPDDIPEIEDYLAMCDATLEAINAVHEYGYYCAKGGSFSGNTIDWGYGSMGVKYSFLMELRDDGEYGFLLPPEQILPTDEENWAGLKVMGLRILAEEEEGTK